MKPKRWLAAVGIVVFAYVVAVLDMAMTWPRSPQPVKPMAPTGALGVSLVDFATGLDQPVDIAFTPIAGDTRMFVVERPGQIRIVQANGVLRATPFLDIRNEVDSSYEEMGMLGLAFELDYATSGRFYVYYTGPGGPGGNTLHLSRFQVSGNPDVADPTETSILTIDHPDYLNHNGGQLRFGPDGFLYLGPGDGGSAGDPPNNAQHTDRLLGKLLRLNVSGVSTYTIPASNPFTQTVGARAEVWAFGLRNPFRFSFDRGTGELYIADVGQNLYEEVDYQPAGAGGRNSGWPCYEGFHDYNPGDCVGVTNIISPVAEYPHSSQVVQVGDAIIGGYVYRGGHYPALQGYYFYADNGTGNMWAMRTCSWQVTQLGHMVNSPSSFGEDAQGELYIAGLDGVIHKLVGPTALAARPEPGLGIKVFLPMVYHFGPCSG
jgi:glucose/arabinose dehydrogenase